MLRLRKFGKKQHCYSSARRAIQTGAVLSKEQFKKLIALSDQYGFVIGSDECYSELWFDEAPVGLL